MCCEGLRDEFILRLGAERAAEILGRKHSRAFDSTGRPMRGFVRVESAALRLEAALKSWAKWGGDYAASFPVK